MNREDRIKKERLEMHLAPWEFSPSQVDDSPNPYSEGVIGHRSWNQAQEWRKQLLKTNPNYFDED
jgi:hypothetical protein